MNEWTHNCKGAGRVLLIPHGEQCDRCGMNSPDLLDEDDWQAIADAPHVHLAFIPGALKEAVEERIKLRLASEPSASVPLLGGER